MKRIIITGANQGIGFYMVRRLLELGHQVTVLDLEVNQLTPLVLEYKGQLLPIQCNMKDDEMVKKSIARSVELFSGVDIAIHNACLCTFDSMESSSLETYHEVFDVNYFGALRLIKAVLPYMKEAGAGKIILVSSGVGVTGFVNISPYASSKGAIESFSKCMNIEYQNSGITFHLFHPPLTNTKSASQLPIPKEFMADPKKVGIGFANHIEDKQYIICHSFTQKIQVKACYLMSVKMGKFLSKMTSNYKKKTFHEE